MATRSERFASGGIALLVASLTAACSSSSSPASGDGSKDAGDSPPVTNDSGPAPIDSVTETGVMVDYESLKPVAGLTVTDNGVSTTTNDAGAFTLTLPSSVTLLQPTVTGTSYSMLLFPKASPAGAAADYGTNVIPAQQTYSLEQAILSNDQTKALVQIVVQVTGACTNAAGGTLQVLSPTGTSVSYFSTNNVPDPNSTSFQAVTTPRPVAVIYDIPVGAELTLAVTHPTCTLMAFPMTSHGMDLQGQVTTQATEPGDVNGAIVLTLH